MIIFMVCCKLSRIVIIFLKTQIDVIEEKMAMRMHLIYTNEDKSVTQRSHICERKRPFSFF